MNQHLYGQLIYDKESKNYHGKKRASSINGVGKMGQLHEKELKWTTLSHHSQKEIQNGLKT